MNIAKVSFRDPKKPNVPQPITTEKIFHLGDSKLGSAKYISEHKGFVVVPCNNPVCCKPRFVDDIVIDIPIKVDLDFRGTVYVAHRHNQRKVNYIFPIQNEDINLSINPKSKIIPLGGIGSAGSASCYLLVHGKEAIMFDCGVTPGRLQADTETDDEIEELPSAYPNFSLIPSDITVTTIFITHGHLDHYGGLAEYLNLLKIQGKPFPRILGSSFTTAMITSFFESNDMKNCISCLQRINNPDDEETTGPFRIQAFPVSHSVPDCYGYAVHIGDDPEAIVFTGDYKARFDNPIDILNTMDVFKSLGHVKILFGDCTNSMIEGLTGLESTVDEGLIDILTNAPGRVIISLFSTHISRIERISRLANRLGKSLAIVGSSFEKTLEASAATNKTMQYQIRNPGNADVIIVAGCQADDNSSARQLSLGGNISGLKIIPSDTIVISALPIPGRKHAVVNMINDFRSLNAEVIIDYGFRDNMFNVDRAPVHVSGHGFKEDIKTVLETTKPDYFVPVHCGKEQAQAAGNIALEIDDYLSNQVIVFGENGHSILF